MQNLSEMIKGENIQKNLDSKRMEPALMHLIKRLEITDKEAAKKLSALEDTVCELSNCKDCKGLAFCKNKVKGFVYYPKKEESKITFNYIPCKFYKKHEDAIKAKSEMGELQSARMKNIDVTDANRVTLIKWIKKFYDSYDSNKIAKGLYLHGSFGSGKTFLIAALLNELSNTKNVEHEIVYFPELLRELKDDFSLLDRKVNYLSNVELLLIDDIGSEKVTEWSRDEILGTILQERMNNHLTTFFTSNLTINELEKHLSNSKDSVDEVKARRIIERIKQLTEDMELITENKRK